MLTIFLLNTRPAITQCTGSGNEEEIYNQFGFPIGRRIDFCELGDNYRTRCTSFGEDLGQPRQLKGVGCSQKHQ